ncbi:MAG: hypothetical protein V2I34_12095, partial [Bacteroidales bacterium]|nr:hypothetical protein [Bacteroidales bacterium]
MQSRIISKTEEFVRNYLHGVESGHNWWHIHRVRNMAMYIFSYEKKGDPFIIEIASLLHDIGDYKVKSATDNPDLRTF